MTYRELLSELMALPSECLDDHVTVYDTHADEFFEVSYMIVQAGSDVLHDGHRYLLLRK